MKKNIDAKKKAKANEQKKKGSKMNTKQKKNNGMEKATNKTVSDLSRQAEKEKSAWVEQGRLINEYIDLSKKYGITQDDALDRLVAHPDSIHHKAQLRNYKVAYEMYESLGKYTGCDLSMTHYIVLSKKGLTPYKRENLLKKAVSEKMSVNDLKTARDKMLGKGGNNKKTVAEKLLMTASHLNSHVHRFIPSDDDASEISDEQKDKFRNIFSQLVDMACYCGLLDIDELDFESLEDAA